jgi:hypothetical protein
MSNSWKLKTFSHLSATERAYIAGLIDGEGSISIVKWKTTGKRRSEVRVSIYNCNRAMISWLEDKLHAKRRNVPRSKPSWKQAFVVALHSVSATLLLQTVLPYLVAKQGQAELVITYQSTKRRVGRKGTGQSVLEEREEMISQIHLLNKRGRTDAVAS